MSMTDKIGFVSRFIDTFVYDIDIIEHTFDYVSPEFVVISDEVGDFGLSRVGKTGEVRNQTCVFFWPSSKNFEVSSIYDVSVEN